MSWQYEQGASYHSEMGNAVNKTKPTCMPYIYYWYFLKPLGPSRTFDDYAHDVVRTQMWKQNGQRYVWKITYRQTAEHKAQHKQIMIVQHEPHQKWVGVVIFCISKE